MSASPDLANQTALNALVSASAFAGRRNRNKSLDSGSNSNPGATNNFNWNTNTFTNNSKESNRQSQDDSRNQDRDRDSKDRDRDRDKDADKSDNDRNQSADKNARDGARNRVTSGNNGGNVNPPRTLVEAYQRWSKPGPASQTPQSARPGASSATAQPAKALDRAQAAQIVKASQTIQPAALGGAKAAVASVPKGKAAVSGLSGGSGGSDISPTISKTEVLGVNLSASATARALSLGFTADNRTILPNIRAPITRLTPPQGMGVLEARQILQTELPSEKFGLNRIYRIYRWQSNPRPPERTAPAGHDASAACLGDRCAGRQLIQWKPHLQSCTAGLRIGVIDTDVDHLHPTFPPGKLKLGTFIPAGRTAAPNWHGTGVVALLAGQPKSGTPGMVAQGDFFIANVFFNDESGEFATDTASILRALDWMDKLDIQLINMSFAGPRDDLVQKAIANMSNKGIVFVAAAGNEGPLGPPSYPAAYKQVIAVAAVNKEQRNYPYSTRGDHIDVSAPGVDVWTALPGAREGYQSGTSFAAPYVTSIIATILANSPRRQKTDLLNALTVVDLGQPGRDQIYGRGLLIAPESCNPQAVAAASAGLQPSAIPQPHPAQTSSTGSGWTPVSTRVSAPTSGISAGFR